MMVHACLVLLLTACGLDEFSLEKRNHCGLPDSTQHYSFRLQTLMYATCVYAPVQQASKPAASDHSSPDGGLQLLECVC